MVYKTQSGTSNPGNKVRIQKGVSMLIGRSKREKEHNVRIGQGHEPLYMAGKKGRSTKAIMVYS